jgi:AraC family transcriptional regulator of adaptative response/methylated-DNA-[protein]-cysteine methyltransferase
MLCYTTEQGICLLEFTDRKNLNEEIVQLLEQLQATLVEKQHLHHHTVRRQLSEYFDKKRQEFLLPVVPSGTAFQQSVWLALQDIPYGKTISYKQQAEAMAKPSAIRAIAAANGKNRIAIVIPCHRVVGSTGSLTGYGGGLWRKEWLLNFEQDKPTVKQEKLAF